MITAALLISVAANLIFAFLAMRSSNLTTSLIGTTASLTSAQIDQETVLVDALERVDEYEEKLERLERKVANARRKTAVKGAS